MDNFFLVFPIMLGLVGAGPGFFAIFTYFTRYLPTRRFLGFGQNLNTSIIVTTSAVAENPVGASVLRATTGVGQLKGVAIAARALGSAFPRSAPTVYLSAQMDSRPNEHVILLGGPANNAFTRLFLEELPEGDLIFDDVDQKVLCGDVSFEGVDVNSETGMPEKEVILVIAAHNPFSKNPRAKAVLCCGLTSFGTVAAASWYFDELLRKRPYRKETYEGSLIKIDNEFIALLEVQYAGGQPAGMKLVHHQTIG